MSLVVIGSVAFDDVETRYGRRKKILGGSASYFSFVASNFTPVKVVAVVGDDFPQEYISLFENRKVDIKGLVRKKGKTFFWRGKYSDDFTSRKTLQTNLNVFSGFNPLLPDVYKSSPFLFLANIHPALQLQVLESMTGDPFVACDTMNLWINTEKQKLLDLIKKIDLLTINDEEARLLSGEFNVIRAGKAIQKMGPEYLVIKRGEYGAILFLSETLFFIPAFPLLDFKDPTGAGDSFAGGFMGYIAGQGKVNEKIIKKSMLYAAVCASFSVEDFSLERLQTLSPQQINSRYDKMINYINPNYI
ncbi:MAG: PfkB family carbohydrate kinase [Myxococcota bacterium]